MRTYGLVFTCLIVLFSYSTFAQVDDIKKGADKNRSGKSNEQGITSGRGSSGGSGGDACMESCVQSCCDVVGSQIFQIMAAFLVEGQRAMLEASDLDPTIRSFDIDPQGAYNPKYDAYLILPRIRGTYGIFATDFRLNYLLGNNANGRETFKTYEWQILQLNLASRPHFNLRVGSGIYWQNYHSTVPGEGYITQSFNEHQAEMSLKFDDQRYITTLAGRWAIDYQTNNNVFTEFSVVQNIQIMKSSGFRGYFSLGLNVENYYSSTRLVSVQAGLHFNLFATSPVGKASVEKNQLPQF